MHLLTKPFLKMAKIDEFKNEMLDYTQYSPDLAPVTITYFQTKADKNHLKISGSIL